MAVTTFPPISRSRTLFPRLGPSTGPVIREFPSPGGHRFLTVPRRPGVGSPTTPERRGTHDASAHAALGSLSGSHIDALLGRAIDAALESLNDLERQAREVGRWLRTNACAEAREGLRDLVAATERMVTLASASADVSGTDLTTFCLTHGLTAETTTASLMNELVLYQRAGNDLALAAALERRFVAALEDWRQLFFALGDFPPDPSGHAA